MAREGIYVGGKEIVRRYVGDKLVWRKIYYEQVYSGTYVVTIDERPGLEKEFKIYGDGLHRLVGNLGEGKIELNGSIASFKSLNCEFVSGSYYALEHQKAIITFLTQNDKNIIQTNRVNDANIKIFKKVYK